MQKVIVCGCRMRKNFVRLVRLTDVSVEGDDTPLPSEFRVFAAGVNATRKGDFVFDADAAREVMAVATQWGVDLMIDLEHRSLDPFAVSNDDTATDAMGWYRLELREDGGLWAVGVRWTAEGARRLRAKLQRYISPAFETDDEGKPTWVINVALTSMPATDNAMPLVAASGRTERREPVAASAGQKTWRCSAMDPELMKKALEVIAAGDEAGALALLSDIVASAAGADMSSDDAAAEGADAPAEGGDGAAMVAAAARQLTGKEDVGEIVAAIEALIAQRVEDATRAEALELSSRRELVADLVRLGAETPATAWEGEPSARKPCARLMTESVDGLRERVRALRAARGTTRVLRVQDAGAGDGLTDAERKVMLGLPEAKREDYRQLRLSRRAS